MDPRVAAILAKKQEETQQKKDKKKEALLLDLNLFDKVYSPNDEYDDEYPYCDWDEEKCKNLYYKKVPIPVTDEEYEALKECVDQEGNHSDSNPVATTLSVLGWLTYIIGFIAGIIVYSQSHSNDFSIALGVWGSVFIEGTLFLAIAEIIKQLFKLNKKVNKLTQATESGDAAEGE